METVFNLSFSCFLHGLELIFYSLCLETCELNFNVTILYVRKFSGSFELNFNLLTLLVSLFIIVVECRLNT